MAETGRELADLAVGAGDVSAGAASTCACREKTALASVPAIAAAMERVERRSPGSGRLLVRYSGTEPLLRVMIEGKDQQEIQGWAREIADSVKLHLG